MPNKGYRWKRSRQPTTEEVMQMRRDGDTYATIASHFRVSRQRIHQLVKDAIGAEGAASIKAKAWKNSIPDATKEKILEMFLDGATCHEIEAACGVSDGTIYKMITASIPEEVIKHYRSHLRPPNPVHEEVVRLFIDGMTSRAIALAVGRNRNLVNLILAQNIPVEILDHYRSPYFHWIRTPEDRIAQHDRFRARNRKRYAENPEGRRASCRKWYSENKEKVRLMNKKYLEKNREKLRERSRNYYIKNREKLLAQAKEANLRRKLAKQSQ